MVFKWIEDGISWGVGQAMVKRIAKVIFFCHISNDRSSFTNPHLMYVIDGWNIHC